MKVTAEERLHRILAMIPWIVAHDGPTVAATCARFSCSPEDLARDIELLYLCGLHPYTPDLLIEAGVVDGRVFVQYADYLSRPLRLTPAEGLVLLASAETLLQAPGTDLDGPLARGLAKLAEAVGSSEAIEVQLAPADPEILELLRVAADAGRQVQIDYYAYGRDDTSTRTIEPASVFTTGGAWYVAAFCHRADAERSFRVDRILSAKSLPLARTGPVLDGGPRTLNPQGSGAPVVIDLAEGVAWVQEQYPTESVEARPDGTTRVTIRVGEWPWLDRVLLRLGVNARVVESPPDWPGRLAAAERIRRRYARPPAAP